MKLHALLGEVWRNVVSGTSRTITLASIFALLLTALALADAVVVSSLVTEARDFQARAASVVTVSAEGRVSGASCEALTGVQDVQAAGAMRATPESVHPATLPGSPVPVIEVSPGFLATLGSARQAGAHASADLLDALGSKPGDR